MDENERRSLEAYRQDRRDGQNRERISGQMQNAETRKEAMIAKAHIDQQTKIELAGFPVEQLRVLHDQSKENRELEYSDLIRNENVRLQSLQAQLDMERVNYVGKIKEETANAKDIIKENLKAEIIKFIIQKLLNDGVESLTKDQRDFLQEQARQDLGI